ncbi:hypothetical protein GCM10022379_04850 [Micromonospora maritima]
MASADICSSATNPLVYASTTQSICPSLSTPPSRFARMTSTAVKALTYQDPISNRAWSHSPANDDHVGPGPTVPGGGIKPDRPEPGAVGPGPNLNPSEPESP